MRAMHANKADRLKLKDLAALMNEWRGRAA